MSMIVAIWGYCGFCAMTAAYQKFYYKKKLKSSLYILGGILSAGLGLKGFLMPNSFIDGGVTGISLLIAQLTNLPLSLLLVVINLPFIILGVREIGKKFAIKTIISIAGLALALVFIKYPAVTSDKLLVSVFGGFFLGLGIGLCMRGGSVIDGTEILSLFISRKYALSVGDIILVINILIFSAAALAISLESAFYSLLTYLSASKTVDFLTVGVEEYIGLMVISNRSEEVRKMIIEGLGKGATLLKAKRGFGRRNGVLSEFDIVYTITTKLELAKVKEMVERIDQTAFLIMHNIHDVKGGIIKRRPFH